MTSSALIFFHKVDVSTLENWLSGSPDKKLTLPEVPSVCGRTVGCRSTHALLRRLPSFHLKKIKVEKSEKTNRISSSNKTRKKHLTRRLTGTVCVRHHHVVKVESSESYPTCCFTMVSFSPPPPWSTSVNPVKYLRSSQQVILSVPYIMKRWSNSTTNWSC